MDAHKKMEQLLNKYLSGNCTPAERLQVERWYRQLDLGGELPSMEEMESDLADIRRQLPGKPAKRYAPWYRYVAAATVAAVMAIGAHAYVFQSELSGTESEAGAASVPDDLAPGGSRAHLQLADGRELVPDQRADRAVPKEGRHAI